MKNKRCKDETESHPGASYSHSPQYASSHESKHDERTDQLIAQQGLENRRSPDRFNTIQIFGKPRIKDRESLLQLCRRTGILVRKGDVIRVQTRGYRNIYDSRCLLIVFSNSLTAKRFEVALRSRQKYVLAWKNTAHKTAYTLAKQSKSNRFSALEQQWTYVPDALHSDPEHDESPQKKPMEYQYSDSSNSACWKICTYNIQSLRNKTRLQRLSHFLVEQRIDVMAVQETNWDGDSFFSHLPRVHVVWLKSGTQTKWCRLLC